MNLVQFDIHGTAWGVRLKWVSHVITSRKIDPLPNAQSMVAGLINVRGEIIPVIRGSELLLSKKDKKVSPKILLLSCEGASLGLLVDSVTKIVQGVFLGDDDEDSTQLSPFVQGACMVDPGIKINVLDVLRLFQALTSKEAANPVANPENQLVKEET